MTIRLSRVLAMLGVALAPLSVATAQTTTIDFSTHGGPNYLDIAQTFGDHANLDVTYSSRAGFNQSAQVCASTDYWGPGYSSLAAATFACANGLVGQMYFQPLNGNMVFLQSLQIGSYPANSVGIGPSRSYAVHVWDSNWAPLYSSVGTVSSTLTLTPNASSASGLYLQWGPDWNTGINNITTDVTSVTATPEPSSIVLLATGFAGIVGFARRRRASA